MAHQNKREAKKDLKERNFVPMLERPGITAVLNEVTNNKDYSTSELAHTLASKVYRELIKSGLYDYLGESFTKDGKRQQNTQLAIKEKLNLKSEFSNTLQSIFSLLSILKTRYSDRGQIVANLFAVHLGIKIATDTSLKNNRRNLLMEELQLYYMPVGLYDSQWNELTPEKIDPAVMFDRKRIKRNLLIGRIHGYTQVDVKSFLTAVDMLQKMVEVNRARHEDLEEIDDLIEDWGNYKLNQLEKYAESLNINWKAKSGYKYNNESRRK